MEFEFPDTLPTEADALAHLRAEAVEAFNDLYNGGATPSAETLTSMEAIVDGIKTIDVAFADLTDAEARGKSAADLAAALADKKNDEDDADGDDEDAEEGEDDEDAGEQASLAASGTKKRTRFSQAAGGKIPDVPETEKGWRLTTSAKNYESGVVDSLKVATEFSNLAVGGAARVIGAGGKTRTTLAYLDRQSPDEFAITDAESAQRVLDHVTDESRLPGGSLVAAGGWCSPSETVYDFLPTQAATGLLSLPEVTIRRGGIRFPEEPDFNAIFDEVGFYLTETQMQAGTEKTCIEVPCTTEFDEVRLDAAGICITAGILQDKAWPEQTRKFVDESLRLHQHKISGIRINKIVTGSTNVGTLTGPMFGTAGAVLSALELQVADMRARHRLAEGQSVEGMAPVWLLNVIRADLAFRDEVLPQQVTDASIKAHFANIGVNFQFVTDWQTSVIGAATPAVAWPATVQVALWTAGTWWAATEPVINLGILHDSTLLKQNKQVQMFTEDGVAVGKRGLDSRVVTIPLAVDGTVGARYAAPVEP